MNSTFLRMIIEKTLGSVVRHGITCLGLWLFEHGLPALDAGSQANIANIIMGAIMIGGGLIWSIIRSHLKQKQINDLAAFASHFGIFKSDEKPPPSVPPAALALFIAFMTATMVGCAAISSFDQNSYVAASGLKGEAIALISNALEPAAHHQEAIAALDVKLSAQVAYEEGKGKKNIISLTQWKILVSPDRELLGRFLEDWENGKEFSPAYLAEKIQQISDAFDQILKLEGAKAK